MWDRRTPLAAGLDVATIVLFVSIGQREHDTDSGLGALVSTAAPFLIGLAVAWMAVRVWRRPTAWTTGLLIWPITVIVGMVLRNVVWDDGTAAAFVMVATAFIGTLLIGWRAVLGVLDRRRLAS